ncbi:MAG: polymer-forming cytoskeletal protein [Halobacteriota archaeon]
MQRLAIRRTLVLLLVAVVLFGSLPAIASAQSTERTGGVVVVEADETVPGDLNAVGGTVVVRGTVDGNVEATAGTVVVEGTIGGDLEAVAGSIVIEGTVDGDVGAAGGSVLVREQAEIGGTLEAAAGSTRLEGTVGGDARLAGEEVVIAETAVVDGNVEYDAETFTASPDATVGGTVTQTEDLSIDVAPAFTVPGDFEGPTVPTFPSGIFAAYGLLVNLVLGVILLVVAPTFGDRVSTLGRTDTVKSGIVGVLEVVGIPIGLLLLFVTIVGIPLSLAGFVLFALLLWITQVYGALVVGTWLLSLAGTENLWGALVLGVVLLAVLAVVPFGSVVQFFILAIGLGAFTLALRERHTGGGDRKTGESDERPREGSPAS